MSCTCTNNKLVIKCSERYVLTPTTKSATTQYNYNTFYIKGTTRAHTNLKLTQGFI